MMKLVKFKGYFLNLILIWLVFIFYKTFPYYNEFLRQDTLKTILYLSLAYTLFGFFYYLFIPHTKIKETKGALIFKALKNPKKIEKQEKTAMLFVIVKIFFLPIMLNFFFGNFNAFKYQLSNISNISSLFTISSFNLILFPALLTLIFLIDTLWFSFGYAFESKHLKNEIRSVEPTILGWIVAIACYPPFNSFVVNYTNWYANDYVLFSSDILTFIIRIIIIFLLLIYVGATLALGSKCSNLTNRGIVSRGPYSIIRHPAYISKNLAWWITIIPIASWSAIISMAIWSFIYHLRTITEERHLNQDQEYILYKSKVRYRYIPGIY
jgi:protein-S-isoprenylcysteine O-methyltransferase Ste14